MTNSHGPIVLKQWKNPSISYFAKSDTFSNQISHSKRNSLSINKLFAPLCPTKYSYGVQAKTSNVKIFQSFPSICLRLIINAPGTLAISPCTPPPYLQIPNIYTLASHFYKLFHKNTLNHSNPLITNLSSLTLSGNPPCTSSAFF